MNSVRYMAKYNTTIIHQSGAVIRVPKFLTPVI